MKDDLRKKILEESKKDIFENPERGIPLFRVESRVFPNSSGAGVSSFSETTFAYNSAPTTVKIAALYSLIHEIDKELREFNPEDVAKFESEADINFLTRFAKMSIKSELNKFKKEE